MANNDQIRLRTSKFRAAFVNVFAARKNDNGRDEFSLVAIFPADDPWLKEAKAAALAACRKKWGDKIPEKMKNPFKKGPKLNKQGVQYDGFGPDIVYLNFKTYQRPGVVDAEGKTPITDPSDFYSGCYARATISAFAETHKTGGPYVSFFLNNVQKWSDGPPFGRSRAENDFEAVEGAASSAAAPAAGEGDSLFG